MGLNPLYLCHFNACLIVFLLAFLDAPSHLYKRVCLSVRRSICPSVCRSIRRSVTPSFKRLRDASNAEYSSLFTYRELFVLVEVARLPQTIRDSMNQSINVLFLQYRLYELLEKSFIHPTCENQRKSFPTSTSCKAWCPKKLVALDWEGAVKPKAPK